MQNNKLHVMVKDVLYSHLGKILPESRFEFVTKLSMLWQFHFSDFYLFLLRNLLTKRVKIDHIHNSNLKKIDIAY